MPATRSSARLAKTLGMSSASNTKGYDVSIMATGKKAAEERSKKLKTPVPTLIPTPLVTTLIPEDIADALVPATLTFSLGKAKEHLIRVDDRFEDIFDKIPCKPYENLEQFHPFR